MFHTTWILHIRTITLVIIGMQDAKTRSQQVGEMAESLVLQKPGHMCGRYQISHT